MGEYEFAFVRSTLSNGEMAVRTAPTPLPKWRSRKSFPDTEPMK